MSQMEIELARVSCASEAQVRNELTGIWHKISNDPSTRSYVSDQGLELGAFANLKSCPFETESSDEGDGTGVAEAILIGIAVGVGKEVATSALKALWVKIIKPRLESKFHLTASDNQPS